VPTVSVLLAVHNGAPFVAAAVESVLGQTFHDLELLVVDDASTDDTPEILAAVADRRLGVLRNDEQAGLARSLNRGLDDAAGRYVARLDADDVAQPDRLERQVEAIQRQSGVAVLGSAISDLNADGDVGRTHVLPGGARALRWHALFSSPFFHPTVLVDRELLDRQGLRYDPAFLESEDYDLWTRVFAFGDGANLRAPLVLKRVHEAQASLRRKEVQERFQREVAFREIAHIAPELAADDAELAWRLGVAQPVPRGSERRAGDAMVELLRAFERVHGADRSVRAAAARALLRARLVSPALRVTTRSRAPAPARQDDAVRVTVVSPEPTPYRSPLLDRIAERDEVDLHVIYAAPSVAGRTWLVEPQHPNVVLRGVGVPGARSVLRHHYPVTPGVIPALNKARPDVVVVSGWSTFASQTAIAWCRVHRVPYVLLVESHDLGPRAGWRRFVKGAVVPRLLRGAAGVLVVGTAARESVLARGARADRVRVFANTVDIECWMERADRLPARSSDGDVVVLSVGRLVPDKGFDVLLHAIAQAGDERLRLVIAGDGPEATRLAELAEELGVRVEIKGDLPEAALAAEYVAADVFALLSRHEPWGVVVNEAAASGLSLVLSDRVGAAHDLLRDGENGFLVPAGEVAAAAAALGRLAADASLRRSAGVLSREVVREWGYEPSVENFVAAVRDATAR
jgi:glycosyltransferase involved in cell wall biosynthesis